MPQNVEGCRNVTMREEVEENTTLEDDFDKRKRGKASISKLKDEAKKQNKK